MIKFLQLEIINRILNKVNEERKRLANHQKEKHFFLEDKLFLIKINRCLRYIEMQTFKCLSLLMALTGEELIITELLVISMVWCLILELEGLKIFTPMLAESNNKA